MKDYRVGAGILNIITESLYDNPIVVFREYIQNAVDSIFKVKKAYDKCEIRIWKTGNSLLFLDNGTGINSKIFEEKMTTIAISEKSRTRNLGYKGIGRLSGVPYCEKLIFVNICDYLNKKVQIFSIDSAEYRSVKDKEEYSELSFHKLIDKISICEEEIDLDKNEYCHIRTALEEQHEMFAGRNTGLLVVLENISLVLKNTTQDENFFNSLQWLLPVDFENSLYGSEEKELFEELTVQDQKSLPPVRFCKISYEGIQVFRPIKKDMLRTYVCKSDYKYAIGFHTFQGDKIVIDKSNSFSGIRIYIDNMLLCDENELVKNLESFGLLNHTTNGQLQSVKGIGALIYITDKVSISANARRTFIEVVDNASLDFLKILAEFIDNIYEARYALSNYTSAKGKYETEHEKLDQLKNIALKKLQNLAKEKIELPPDVQNEPKDFSDMNVTDKKKTMKKKIADSIERDLKSYLEQLDKYNLENAYQDFLNWIASKT